MLKDLPIPTFWWSLPLVCFVVSLNRHKTYVRTVSKILIFVANWTLHLHTFVRHYSSKLFARNNGRKGSYQGVKITECTQLFEHICRIQLSCSLFPRECMVCCASSHVLPTWQRWAISYGQQKCLHSLLQVKFLLPPRNIVWTPLFWQDSYKG